MPSGFATVGSDCDHVLVSVVVCTLGRRDTLSRCLDSVVAQSCGRCEILVVLNGEMTASFHQRYGQYPVRILCEPRRGVNAARNLAVREARGEILAFLDDDTVPHPDWLHQLVQAFSDPGVAGVTGRVILEGPVFLPRDKFERGYTSAEVLSTWTVEKADSAWLQKVLGPALGYGCNMAFRKQAFGPDMLFPEDMGAGSKIPAADESYFFFKVLNNGAKICHSSSAVVTHVQEPDRSVQKHRMIDLYAAMMALRVKLIVEEKDLRLSVFRNLASAMSRRLERLNRRPRKDDSPELLTTSEKFSAYLRGLSVYYQSRRQRKTPEASHKVGAWLAVLLWMALIAYLSSDAFGGSWSEELLRSWAAHLNLPLGPEGLHLLNLFLRKTAHLLEFLVLGALLSWAVAQHPRQSAWRGFGWVLLAGGCAAIANELLQTLTVTREASFFDVALNLAGVLGSQLWIWGTRFQENRLLATSQE